MSSLGSPVEPIHVKYGDRYFKFGFELCRTWEGIDGLIKQTLRDIRAPALNFEQGLYDLRGLDNHIISRWMWSNTARPGLVVFLMAQSPRPLVPFPATVPVTPRTKASAVPRVSQVGSQPSR
ncbi:hypothetical protein Daesc_004699 [Daldinia eschscholtzii]|uniref:Ubiquitin-like domain-containing protein n=1 Tax=Daldinia eschscholtzii TaxID=292717 RepID=A0AAX6MPY8_9PEZI